MARSPQSFEKRQRERRKELKRREKLERRLVRSEEKRTAKENGDVEPEHRGSDDDDQDIYFYVPED